MEEVRVLNEEQHHKDMDKVGGNVNTCIKGADLSIKNDIQKIVEDVGKELVDKV